MFTTAKGVKKMSVIEFRPRKKQQDQSSAPRDLNEEKRKDLLRFFTFAKMLHAKGLKEEAIDIYMATQIIEKYLIKYEIECS
jgi:hypothetical protein